jgi:hypothetical protein
MLADETCWLVAIDLTGPDWREDVGALPDRARDMDDHGASEVAGSVPSPVSRTPPSGVHPEQT